MDPQHQPNSRQLYHPPGGSSHPAAAPTMNWGTLRGAPEGNTHRPQQLPSNRQDWRSGPQEQVPSRPQSHPAFHLRMGSQHPIHQHHHHNPQGESNRSWSTASVHVVPRGRGRGGSIRPPPPPKRVESATVKFDKNEFKMIQRMEDLVSDAEALLSFICTKDAAELLAKLLSTEDYEEEATAIAFAVCTVPDSYARLSVAEGCGSLNRQIANWLCALAAETAEVHEPEEILTHLYTFAFVTCPTDPMYHEAVKALVERVRPLENGDESSLVQNVRQLLANAVPSLEEEDDELLDEEDRRDRNRAARFARCNYATIQRHPVAVQPLEGVSSIPTTHQLFQEHMGPITQRLVPTCVDKTFRWEDRRIHIRVQFALMQEDFIASLRDSIQLLATIRDRLVHTPLLRDRIKMVKEAQSGQGKHGRVPYYPRIQLRDFSIDKVKGPAVSFVIDDAKKLHLNKGKRLMNGSLVILVKEKDGFQADSALFLGTVRRHRKEMSGADPLEESGAFAVELLDLTGFLRATVDSASFAMVESDAFFLPYYRTLDSLKALDRDDANYAILGPLFSAFDPAAPTYIARQPVVSVGDYFLLQEGAPVAFDVRGAENWRMCAPWSAEHEKEGRAINRDDGSPSNVVLLDATQQEALRHMLGHTVAVVQGTPGTGKTFVGTRLVHMLMQTYPTQPIVLLTVTNHALDSFLKDVVRLHGEETDIVRLGVPSKDPNLARLGINPRPTYFEYESQERFSNTAGIIQKAKAAKHITVELQPHIVDILEEYNITLFGSDDIRELMEMEAKYTKLHQQYQEAQALKADIALLKPFENADLQGLEEAVNEMQADIQSFEHELKTKRLSAKSRTTLQGQIHDHKDSLAHTQRILDRYPVRTIRKLCNDIGMLPRGASPHNLPPIALLLDRTSMEVNRREKEYRALSDWFRIRNRVPAPEKPLLERWRTEGNGNATPLDMATLLHHQASHAAREADGVEAPNQHDENDLQRALGLREMERRGVVDDDDASDGSVEDHHHGAATLMSEERRRHFMMEAGRLAATKLNNHSRNRIMELLLQELLCRKSDEMRQIMLRIDIEKNTIARKDARLLAEILRGKRLIAGTSAAIMKSLPGLKLLGITTLIVEEAAEVLESHVLACLTPHIQHLVLIGDHKQLRPKVQEYVLETKMNLGISLMERLALRNYPLVTLTTQRRMHPVISDFTKAYYRRDGHCIQDHPRTECLPCPLGIGRGRNDEQTRVLFITYNKNSSPRHEEQKNEVLQSAFNEYEAEMVSCLADYLFYANRTMRITILVPYTGQLFAVNKQLERLGILSSANVRVRVLDEFQGEEDDIIILSTTRTNAPGFLKEENRVCVALSRARFAMYVVGNEALIGKANVPIWSHFLKLCNERHYKTSDGVVPVHCPVHADTFHPTFSSSEEFKKLQGCRCPMMCTEALAGCGHPCDKGCHVGFPHPVCTRPCERVGELCTPSRSYCVHPCTKRCSDPCPPCNAPASPFTCSDGCGQERFLTCHEYHVGPRPLCQHKIVKVAACGHDVEAPCGLHAHGAAHTKCTEACGTHMPCGHLCKSKCHHGDDDAHVCRTTRCKEVKSARAPCGHVFERECSGDFPKCTQQCNLPQNCDPAHRCSLRCGHKTKCKCLGSVEKVFRGCNHTATIPCEHLQDAVCPVQCEHIVGSCQHRCRNTCGACAVLRYHSCDKKCEKSLICGHQCGSSCGRACLDCRAMCDFSCGHGRGCGACQRPRHACHACDAWTCQESCTWACEHHQCGLRCWEPCTRPVCDSRCSKTHPRCGHRCGGLCGEACPSFCAECYEAGDDTAKAYAERVTSITFPFDDEDIRDDMLHRKPIDNTEPNQELASLHHELPCCGKVVGALELAQSIESQVRPSDSKSVEIHWIRCPLCQARWMPHWFRRVGNIVKQQILWVRRVIVELQSQKSNTTKTWGLVLKETVKQIKEVLLATISTSDTIRAVEDAMAQFDANPLVIECEPLSPHKNNKEYKRNPERYKRALEIYQDAVNRRTRAMQEMANRDERFLLVLKEQFQISNVPVILLAFKKFQERATLDDESQTVENGLAKVQDFCSLTLAATAFFATFYKPNGCSGGLAAVFRSELAMWFSSRFWNDIDPLELNNAADTAKQLAWSRRLLIATVDHSTNTDLIRRIECFRNKIFYEGCAAEPPLAEVAEIDKVLRTTHPCRQTLREVAGAMGLSAGHFYMCPNNHLYTVGECGGAMEETQCPECGAVIGGANHRFAAGNRFAGRLLDDNAELMTHARPENPDMRD